MQTEHSEWCDRTCRGGACLGLVCRGCESLGTACGRCERCRQRGAESTADRAKRVSAEFAAHAAANPPPRERPPLGTVPRRFWIEARIIAVCRAVSRFADQNKVDHEHFKELRKLLADDWEGP